MATLTRPQTLKDRCKKAAINSIQWMQTMIWKIAAGKWPAARTRTFSAATKPAGLAAWAMTVKWSWSTKSKSRLPGTTASSTMARLQRQISSSRRPSRWCRNNYNNNKMQHSKLYRKRGSRKGSVTSWRRCRWTRQVQLTSKWIQ